MRGKVGEHSYYRQTGIASGLVRSINQGMSSRVKNDEAFLNTRLNNSEFGQAGRIASVVAQYIAPKFRPMVLPFSQSKMAKIFLEYIKTNTTAPWGQRNIIYTNSAAAQVAALNSVAKNRFDDFGIRINLDEENSVITCSASATTVNKLSSIGADGFEAIFAATRTWIGTFDPSTGKYAPSYPRANFYTWDQQSPTAEDEFSENYTFRPAPPQGWPAIMAESTGVMVLLPYRLVNGAKYFLQEECTYKAFVIQDGDVN